MNNIPVTSSETTPSTRWHKSIWVCLVGWSVSFIVSVLSVRIGVVLFCVSWIGLPISIFQDARTIGEYSDWPHYTWAYVIGSFVWFVSIIAGGVYLLQRHRKLTLQTTEDMSQSKSGELDQRDTVENTQSKPNNQHVGQNVEQRQADQDLETMRKKAENKVVNSINQKKFGYIDSAIQMLSDSIEQYDQIKQKADSNSETSLLEEIEETVQLAKEKRDSFERSLKNKSELVDDLERAERYLQTAFVAHLNGEDTLANLRYRQARDRYQSAIKTYENELNSIESVEISIPSEKKIKEDDVSGFIQNSDHSKRFYNEIDAVQDPSELLRLDYKSETGASVISTLNVLKHSQELSDKFINKIEVVVYYTKDNIMFKDMQEIKSRYNQADNGYQITSTNT